MMALPPEYFAGMKVTVMGLGHFGGQIAATRFLVGQGAVVTVTDLATEDKLQESLKQIADLSVTLHLGGHIETDFTETDLIVVSPAVPKASRYLKLAEQRGIPFTCEMNLFLDRCRAKTMGITGTVGKSTTVAMTDAILQLAQQQPGRTPWHKVYTGGNIGRSLLELVPHIETRDLVVLELSSFQLEDAAGIEFSPNIAVVTNIAPNHLDRHHTMEEYIAAKANITRCQGAGDTLVLNVDDPHHEAFASVMPGSVQLWRFGVASSLPHAAERALNVAVIELADGFELHSLVAGSAGRSLAAAELPLPGRHNWQNAAAAAAGALAAGVPMEIITAGLRAFRGLEHRLELVSDANGIKWYNDSKSTTPESGIVALRAFDRQKVVAIAGGYDKHLDLTDFARELAQRAKVTLCLGQTGPTLLATIGTYGGQAVAVATLAEAVDQAHRLTQAGDAVLLSPGCASWDMFENYQIRGKQFAEMAHSLANASAGS